MNKKYNFKEFKSNISIVIKDHTSSQIKSKSINLLLQGQNQQWLKEKIKEIIQNDEFKNEYSYNINNLERNKKSHLIIIFPKEELKTKDNKTCSVTLYNTDHLTNEDIEEKLKKYLLNDSIKVKIISEGGQDEQ